MSFRIKGRIRDLHFLHVNKYEWCLNAAKWRIFQTLFYENGDSRNLFFSVTYMPSPHDGIVIMKRHGLPDAVIYTIWRRHPVETMLWKGIKRSLFGHQTEHHDVAMMAPWNRNDAAKDMKWRFFSVFVVLKPLFYAVNIKKQAHNNEYCKPEFFPLLFSLELWKYRVISVIPACRTPPAWESFPVCPPPPW